MTAQNVIDGFQEGAKEDAGRDAYADVLFQEAVRLGMELNNQYHTPEEIREIMGRLTGKEVDRTFRLFPPFYTDFGKNITIGKDVFINSGCHFQDQGGITIGDGSLIGHNVVLATINHDLNPANNRKNHYAPIHIGNHVWIGSNATVLAGVTIGDWAVVAAGAVVSRDVPPLTVAGGVPARVLKKVSAERENMVMKIAVIGARGNLGSIVTSQALDRGFAVKGFIRSGEVTDNRVEVMRKSLFDMTRDDIADCDVMISTYGSGFQADPALNFQAFKKYIELNADTERHLIAIGGAGSLYTDAAHTVYCYETPEHPDFLREISINIKRGIDELKKAENVNWTVVCPSSVFDLEGEHTGNYVIGTEGHLLFNKAGESRVTYKDLAQAMLDLAEKNACRQEVVTVLTDESLGLADAGR